MASRKSRLRSVPDPPDSSSDNQPFTASKLGPWRLPSRRKMALSKALLRMDRAIDTLRTANAAFHARQSESDGKAVDGAALVSFDEGLHRLERSYSRLDTKLSRFGRMRHATAAPEAPMYDDNHDVDRADLSANVERLPLTKSEREYIAARWTVEQGADHFAKELEDVLVGWLTEDPENIRAYVRLVRLWLGALPLRHGSEVCQCTPPD